MAQRRCVAGKHEYDDNVYSVCPFCPVPGVPAGGMKPTEAADSSRRAPKTEGYQAPQGAPIRPGQRPPGGTPNLTVGLFQKKTGVEPVVGWLVCTKGLNTGRDYRLRSGVSTLGRDSKMYVCIEGDDTIAREDVCSLAYDPKSKSFMLLPGQSRNLVYLNNDAVYGPMKLKPYDELEVGQSTFKFIPLCGDNFDWNYLEPAEKPAKRTEE